MGLVEKFFVEKSESNFVSNIRRSFLSQIQLDFSEFENLKDFYFFENHETSILGKCTAAYSVHPMTKTEATESENEWNTENETLFNSTYKRYFKSCFAMKLYIQFRRKMK